MPNPVEDRQARLAKMQAAQKNAERRRSFLVIGLASLLAIALIGVVAVVIVQSERERAAVEAEAESEIEGVEITDDLTQNHVETDVAYAQDPPVGGDHLPAPRWQDCGFYDAPVQEEAAVHSLEHGAVWITHSPDLPADQVARLEELSGENNYLLVSPREDLPSDVVLSAWGAQLQLDSVDDERVPVFLTKYLQGEQTPEPGAACSGGVTATL
ncbi:DUF3105 domain-containing protein [Aquipuribacter hungaricus]|uniref:DUF3105 domain-containing protein n=1 Tax=Aquipuribacter hungaricus TaxID=545624 RepID=A0ABV7WH48_9MICO